MTLKPYQPPLFTPIKKTFVCLVILIGIIPGVKGQSSGSEQISDAEERPFANPALIFGTDFVRMFQVFYNQADWESMIRFTSEKSKNEIGLEKLVKYFQRMNFGYSLRINSMKKIGKVYLLNYKAKIYATDQIVRCKIVVENDTCRILLPKNVLTHKIFLYK